MYGQPPYRHRTMTGSWTILPGNEESDGSPRIKRDSNVSVGEDVSVGTDVGEAAFSRTVWLSKEMDSTPAKAVQLTVTLTVAVSVPP